MPIVVTSPQGMVPSTDAVSPDGRIRATVMSVTAGVFIRVDYSSMLGLVGFTWPNPFRLTIWRQTEDGVVSAVRGAQNIAQYGAIMHAYDDEVLFGQQVTYWAEAPTLDGSQLVLTDKVSVLTWEPDGGFTSPGVWIKNLENPDLSTPARCIDWSAGSWASRNATADIWGASQPAVTTDVRKSYNTAMTVLTKDEDEYQALLAAIDASVVYVVGLARHRRRTGYYLIGDIAPSRIGPAYSDYDAWTIGLTGMGRPVSAGHSLVVPGRTYADRKAAMPTFQAVLDAPGSKGYQTANQALNPGSEVDLSNQAAYNSATRNRVTYDKNSGLASVEVTNAATTFGGNQWQLGKTYTDGQTFTVSAWVKVPGTGTTVFFAMRNVTTTVGTASWGTPTAGAWVRVNATYTVPTGQTVDRVAVAYNAAIGVVWLTDDFMAEDGSTAHEYGDGSKGNGWNWTGTPNASVSSYRRNYGAGTEPY